MKETTKQFGFIDKGTGKHQSNTIYDADYLCPTLSASDYKEPIKLAIKNNTKQGYIEAELHDGIDISSRMESHRGTVQKGLAQTLTCEGGNNVGVVVNDKQREREPSLCIRRLHPAECLLLMGFTMEDYESLVKCGLSDNAIYHVAGDGLITTIFGSLINNMYRELNSHEQIINDYVEKEIL